MTWVLAPVHAGGTAGTHGLCCIDPVRGGGAWKGTDMGSATRQVLEVAALFVHFLLATLFSVQIQRYNWYSEKNIFWQRKNCNLDPMVDGSRWWWWSSFLDSTHFWRPIRVNPSFFARLLYTIFEASPPEALFVSRKSGESNHPCLGSDGQNVGFSWTHGNQGYSYSGYPIQTDPRTSVTSIFYHFQPPLLWCLYFWALAAPRSERPGAEPLEPSSPFPVGKVCT